MQGEVASEVGGVLLVARKGVEVRDEGGARDAGGGTGHAEEDVATGLRGLDVAASDGEVERSVRLRELGEERGVAVDVLCLGGDVGAEVLPVGVRGSGRWWIVWRWMLRDWMLRGEEKQAQGESDAAHALEYSVWRLVKR